MNNGIPAVFDSYREACKIAELASDMCIEINHQICMLASTCTGTINAVIHIGVKEIFLFKHLTDISTSHTFKLTQKPNIYWGYPIHIHYDKRSYIHVENIEAR